MSFLPLSIARSRIGIFLLPTIRKYYYTHTFRGENYCLKNNMLHSSCGIIQSQNHFLSDWESLCRISILVHDKYVWFWSKIVEDTNYVNLNITNTLIDFLVYIWFVHHSCYYSLAKISSNLNVKFLPGSSFINQSTPIITDKLIDNLIECFWPNFYMAILLNSFKRRKSKIKNK